MRQLPALLLLGALIVAVSESHVSIAQEKKDEPKVEAKPPAEPTAAEIAALESAFQSEREAAVKAKFPPDALAKADDLAKRGATAKTNNNPRAAARYLRDARWQLPYLPVNLPPNVSRVFGESRMRHADRVNSASYSPDGFRLATASADGTVKVWDLGNGRELVTYRGHAEQVNDPSADANLLKVGAAAFHPKEKMIASVGGTQVHLWEPDTGKRIKVLATIEKSDKPLKCVAFSPDGKSLAVGSDEGILRVYEIESGKNTFSSPARNARIERCAWSPNGKMIGIADNQGAAAIYAPGVGNGLPLSTSVIDGPGECLGIAFTLDNSNILTCGKDAHARLTAGPNPDGTGANNTATRLRAYAGHSGTVTDVQLLPDGKHLVTGGDDKTVRVWELQSGKQLRSFQGHMTRVLAVAVRPDGRQVASASEDGAIRLWDLNTSDDHRALTDATEPIWAVAVSPDGKRAAAAGADKQIRVYDPETGKLEAAFGGAGAITSLAFFADGNRLAAAGGDRIVRIWDVAAKKPAKELPGHELPVLGLAVAGDSKLLVSGGADGKAVGWDVDAGKSLWTWSGKSKAVCAVSIRLGTKQVALGTADGALVILDAAGTAPKELISLTAHVAGVAATAYSPDGTKLATAGGDGALRIWSVAENGTPTPLAKFEGQVKPNAAGFSPLSAVAFSADGRFVASAGADQVVRIWDVQTKGEIRGLRGHTDWATCVAFGPDGRLLVSGGADKVARIFELAPQEGGGSLGHLLSVNAVAVSPDGKIVATAGVDQTIKLWDLASGREVGTLIGNADIPFALAFYGNGNVALGGRLPTGDTGRMHLWQTAPPRLLNSLTTGEVYSIVALPDGSRIGAWAVRPVLTGGSNTSVKNSSYEVFDKDGKQLVSFADKGNDVKAATFSTDLKWVAAGDEHGVVRLFDLDKKDRIGSDWPLFDKHPVGDLGLTPDKKLLIAIDAGGLLKVANVEKREVIAPATAAHKSGVRGLLISPKGDGFLTIGADREVKSWSLKDPTAPKEGRSWKLPVAVNGAAYAPDGKSVVTANADGTAYVLDLE